MATPPEYGFSERDVREAFIAGAFVGHCVPMTSQRERESKATEYLERFRDMREKQRKKDKK